MKAIGFRATPKEIFYAVVQTTDSGTYEVIASEKVKHPEAMDEPRKLAQLRTTIFDLIKEHEAKVGGIKLIEGNAREKDSFRLNCEGVIQEAFASSSLQKYFFGAIPALTGAFQFEDKKAIKELLDGTSPNISH